jgi:hypothetical protein
MADQSERPEPDHSEDPRDGEVSDRGYPESQPEAPPGASTSDYPEEGPERGADSDAVREGAGEHRAPGVSSEHESPPSKATGNPRAAGG